MNKFARTWSIIRASWQLLLRDREMLVYSALSAACCLLVSISFVLPWIIASDGLSQLANTPPDAARIYILLFLFYFCNYFVITYFNAAIVAGALIRIGGGNPSFADGLRIATARIPWLVGWALIAATIGMVLRLLEERLSLVGKIVTSMIGLAFTVASSLVIPIMVVEKKDGLAALRDSTALLKQTWGEQLISRFSFGLVVGLLSLPAVVLIFLAPASGQPALMLILFAVVLLYILALALVHATLQVVFQAALYAYARRGLVASGFDATMLRQAMGSSLG